MKTFKKTLKTLLMIVLISLLTLVLGVGAFLSWTTLSDYRPPAQEVLIAAGPKGLNFIARDELSLLSWNIGYCGLGKEMDFFFDGGKKMRPPDSLYQKYLNGVFNFLARNDSMDMVLVQEVDVNSRRSFNTSQIDLLKEALPGHTYTFAANYDADFVPSPLLNPMGRVYSGLMSFSKFAPVTAERYSYPLNFRWPMKLFMLDRCFIMERFKTADGKELILINTHNSAYADGEQLRVYEVWLVRSFMLAEYEKGNYVIAGGDWNQVPWDYTHFQYYGNYFRYPDCPVMEKSLWPDDWHWGVDAHAPTNRFVDEAYRPGLTPTTSIDYFITSPNVEILQASVIPTGFEFSDHQPVYLKIRLLNELQSCTGPCGERIRVLEDSLKSTAGKRRSTGTQMAKPEVKPDRFYQRK